MARTRIHTVATHAHPVRSRRTRRIFAPARLVVAGIGMMGLAGLAAALFAPRRLVPQIALPLRDKANAMLAPQAEKLWQEFQETVKSEAVRANLLQGLRSLIARFRHG